MQLLYICLYMINSMMEKILTTSEMQVWGCNGSRCGLLFLHGCLRQWSDPSVLGHTQGPLWWLGLCVELLLVSYPSPFAQAIHLHVHSPSLFLSFTHSFPRSHMITFPAESPLTCGSYTSQAGLRDTFAALKMQLPTNWE